MNSYNQTKKIMDELGFKVNSTSSISNKKVFVVMLEGTESEFDELKRLGAVEIEDKDILSKLPNVSESIKNITYLDNIKADKSSKDINTSDKCLYVSDGSVITENDVSKLSKEIKEIVLKERGIITPLAKDLAKKLGIKVIRIKA